MLSSRPEFCQEKANGNYLKGNAIFQGWYREAT